MEQFSTYSPVRIWVTKPVLVHIGIYYVRLVKHAVVQLGQDNFPIRFYESYLVSQTEQPTLHFRDYVQVSDQFSTFLDDIPLSQALIELPSSHIFTCTRPSPPLKYVSGRRLLMEPVNNYYQNMEGSSSSPVARPFPIFSVPEYQLPGGLAGIVSPTLDISPPPSLSTGASNFSILGSPQYVLGTPCLHPADDFDHVVTPTEVQNHSDPLHVGIEIVLEPGNGDYLEMFGTSKTGTSYSLPGHVILTVPNILGKTCQNRTRLIKDLKVVFEGKSEFCDDAGRYQVVRIVKRETVLSPAEGIKLPAADSHQSSKGNLGATVYSIPFDMIVPGWLPQSFENELVATSYGLVAMANLHWISVTRPTTAIDSFDMMDVDMGTPPALCSTAPVPIVSAASPEHSSRFFPRFAKTVASALTSAMALPNSQSSSSSHPVYRTSQWQPVKIVRHRAPIPSPIPYDDTEAETIFPNIPLRHYTLKPAENSPSPVECVVSVPETIDINGPTLRVSVRLRALNGYVVDSAGSAESQENSAQTSSVGTPGIPDHPASNNGGSRTPAVFSSGQLGGASDSTANRCRQTMSDTQKCKEKIRMVELGMEVEETERYSSTPAQSFSAAYPIPEDQPDECNPHQGPSALLSPPSRLSGMSMFRLTSSRAFKGTRTRTLLLGEDGNPRTYRFEGSGLDLGEGWRKVNIIIPMPPNIEPTPPMANIGNKPAVETETPFLKIKHKLRIRIVCRSTALPGQDTIVVLTTPLRCGTAPKPRRLNFVPASPIDATAGYRILQPSSSLAQQPLLGFSSLPAYCQIFHENGTTREDEDILPLYSPDSPPSYAPFTVQGVVDGALPNDSSVLNSLLESSPATAMTVPGGPLDSSGTSEPVMGITSDHTEDEELTTDTTASDESIPSVPGPRDCRSVSSLYSDIDSNESSEEAHEHHGSYGSRDRGERATAHGNRLPSGRQDHLMSTDRSSSEVSLPDCLEAARRRAVVRSKYRQPSSSSLSRSTTTL